MTLTTGDRMMAAKDEDLRFPGSMPWGGEG